MLARRRRRPRSTRRWRATPRSRPGSWPPSRSRHPRCPACRRRRRSERLDRTRCAPARRRDPRCSESPPIDRADRPARRPSEKSETACSVPPVRAATPIGGRHGTAGLDPRQSGQAQGGSRDPHRRHPVLRRPHDRRCSRTSRSCGRPSRTPAIESIDTSDADSMPGVVAVYTADDDGARRPPRLRDAAADDELRPPLAKGKVRFVGDIVAAVVAETKAPGGRRGRSRDRRLRPAARGRRPRRGARRRCAAIFTNGRPATSRSAPR